MIGTDIRRTLVYNRCFVFCSARLVNREVAGEENMFPVEYECKQSWQPSKKNEPYNKTQ